ncbi:MAG: nitrilase-related carbon-nitrogen hydrolase [Solirubrobacteraceae bacterium]
MLDRAATLDLVDEMIRAAAAQGAELLVVPETWVPGAPGWIDAFVVSGDAEWHALPS